MAKCLFLSLAVLAIVGFSAAQPVDSPDAKEDEYFPELLGCLNAIKAHLTENTWHQNRINDPSEVQELFKTVHPGKDCSKILNDPRLDDMTMTNEQAAQIDQLGEDITGLIVKDRD